MKNMKGEYNNPQLEELVSIT